tara:strand:- start:11926 stop:12276 length:351 start_codon:yes stop_codon:yes gene_type:complete
MTISLLIFFAFAVIGLTNVIVESSIAEPVREWWGKNTTEFFADAIECHQCVGWWSGLLGSLIFFDLSFGFIITAIACAFAGSFLSSFEKVVRNYLVEHYLYIMCKSLQEEREEDEH